jgi:hypothetical protein
MPRHVRLGPFLATPSDKDRSPVPRAGPTVGTDIPIPGISSLRVHPDALLKEGGAGQVHPTQMIRNVMFTLTDGCKPDRRLLSLEINRLLLLAADLQSIRDGGGPTTSDLEDAPLLGNWERGARPAACLFGNVCDHPTLTGMGRPIVTSDVWVLAPDQGWARTRSRWYRLGLPRDAGSVS